MISAYSPEDCEALSKLDGVLVKLRPVLGGKGAALLPPDKRRQLVAYGLDASLRLAELHLKYSALDRAAAVADEAIRIDPKSAAAHGLRARIAAQMADEAAAVRHFEQALRLDAAQVEAFADHGDALLLGNRPEAAEAVFERLLAIVPSHLRSINLLARVHFSQTQYQKAHDLLRRAQLAVPGNRAILLNLLMVCQTLGRADEAAERLAELLTLFPADGEVNRIAALEAGWRPDDAHLVALQQAFAQPDSDEQKLHLGFALYRALEGRGQFEAAFAALAEANRLCRARSAYDNAAALAAMADMAQVFDATRIASLKGCGYRGASPIFITGMPRSGTTLAEQILGCHPQVHAGGELNIIASLAQHNLMAERGGRAVVDTDQLTAPRLQALGRACADKMAALGDGRLRVTDKQPFNFFWIGLIKLILPDARIIACRRDPLATCFANYSSYLPAGSIGMIYDQQELADYYVAYDRLMQHWEAMFPGEIFTLSYERLTEHQEQQTRALLAFCDLPFDPACLDFHQSNRAVATLSAAQVRRPMYSGADRKTANYRAQLAPMVEILEEAGQL